jgi:MFS family permease
MSILSVRSYATLHYGWIIAFTGTAVIFACLGLGRFALGMLLPAMGTALDLSYARMGLIGTGNFVGYMVAVAAAGYAAQRMGARTTIALGLCLVGITMVLVGRSEDFSQILILYILTGIGSGLSNVPLMGLVSHWFYKNARGKAAGIMLSGNGIAILCAGLYIPWVNNQFGVNGWRLGWISMGGAVLGVAVLAATLLRNFPQDKNTTPAGQKEPAEHTASPSTPAPAGRPKWIMAHLGIIYALFGSTYVVYATFIVTALVDEYGFSEQAAGNFWATVGALSIFSGPLFGWFSDRSGRRKGLLLVYSLFTIAYGLVGFRLPVIWLYLSIALFGIAVWSVPTMMAAAVGDYLGPAKAARAFGFVTLFFGMGQIFGPALAGFLADATGTFRIAFVMCGGATMTGALLACFLPRPRP